MVGQSIQLFVNGSAHLPEQGVVSPNQRLALLHDTWGVCNAHHSSADLTMYQPSLYVADDANRIGHTDYFSCVVNKKVTSLDLLYGRELPTGALSKFSQGLIFNVFYGVLKTIVKDNKGGYQILYI
jgi:hypothetical protein